MFKCLDWMWLNDYSDDPNISRRQPGSNFAALPDYHLSLPSEIAAIPNPELPVYLVRFHSLSLLVASSLLAGCQSWRNSSHPLPQVLADQPSQVRVTRNDGGRFTLRRPRLSGDTLVGDLTSSAASGTIAVPLSEVRSLEVRRFNGLKTAGLIAGVGATAILIAAAAGDGDDPPSGGGGGDGIYYSCPLVYSWDGSRWRLDSGTFGGAIARPLARTDVDNLQYAVAERNTLRLRLANELRETDHVDELTVLAVDHPQGLSVAPTSAGDVRVIGDLQSPTMALDSRGGDALARLRQLDDWEWESALVRRDTSLLDDVRDALELTFRRPPGDTVDLVVDARNTVWAAYLVGELVRAQGRGADAWYASLEADSARAESLRRYLASEAFLSVSVLTGRGWQSQGLVWEAGPEVAKRQVLPLDLTGVRDTLLRVRIEAPAAFWTIDRVALDSEPEHPLVVREAHLRSARLASDVDAVPLLRRRDGRMLTLEPGEAAELVLTVPPVEEGMARSYLLRTHGWYRIHSAGGADADEALLAAVFSRPSGVSRTAAARLNAALDRLEVGR
jgi:hypothetical protein